MNCLRFLSATSTNYFANKTCESLILMFQTDFLVVNFERIKKFQTPLIITYISKENEPFVMYYVFDRKLPKM